MKRAKNLFENLFLLIIAVAIGGATTFAFQSYASPNAAAPPQKPLLDGSSTVPEVLNYQGYLTDSGGTPLDGSYSIKFSIYDAASGGNELWTESHIAVAVNSGQVAVLLGGTAPFSSTLFVDYKDTYIGITVDSDPEMTPRQRIHSVPYAMHAQHADQSFSLSAADGDPAGVIIVDNEGRVGIGTTEPNYALDVNGSVRVNGTLHIGLVHRSCNYPGGANNGDCSCAVGEAILSGGTYAGTDGSIRESRPVDIDTWRVACRTPGGSRRDCSGINIMCAKLGSN